MNIRQRNFLSLRMFYGLLFAVLLCSCIPNKKVVLLQHDDVNSKTLIKDSLLRTYAVEDVQYRVQPEDIISVRIESLTPEEFDVYNRPGSSGASSGGGSGGAGASAIGGQSSQLLLGDLVDHEGKIPFILSGKVKVSGLTVYQIQDTLQKIANQSLKFPLVRVRLLNYRVTVLGEVFKEGVVPIGNNRVSILEAVGLAGGLGELADRENIKLVRQHDGKAEVFYINMLDEKLFLSPLYYTQQNDIIIVPPLKQRNYRKYFTQNLALILSSISILFIAINYSRN